MFGGDGSDGRECTRTVHDHDQARLADARRQLVDGLEDLLEDADFERIEIDEIHQAFEEEEEEVKEALRRLDVRWNQLFEHSSRSR